MAVVAQIAPPTTAQQAELLAAMREATVSTSGWPIGVVLDNRDEYRPRPTADGIEAEISIVGQVVRTSYDLWKVCDNLDVIEVAFDDPRAVADAGLLLTGRLAGRLGLEDLVNETVDLTGREGGVLPGRKVMTLVDGMLLGADSIDDMNALLAGRQRVVVGHRVMAPSTLGTFLRAFTFGHVRQLDRVLDVALVRAGRRGRGPGLSGW